MTHDSMIAVIAAHRDGKEIETRRRCDDSDWRPVLVFVSPAGHPGFDFRNQEYRIKPAPPKPREWWITLKDDGINVDAGIPYHAGYPIRAIHVREVLPSTGEEGKPSANKLDDILVGDLHPGQLWWDEHRRWCNGSKTLEMVYVILSADREGELYLWRCAQFMWIDNDDGYCGASDRKFTEDEVRMMTYVGSIPSIKNFKEQPGWGKTVILPLSKKTNPFPIPSTDHLPTYTEARDGGIKYE